MPEFNTRKIVDEDWKARVQREKEQAQLKAAEAEGVAPPGAAAESVPAEAAPEKAPDTSAANEQQKPPAETPANPAFEGLVSMLATQAMYCLGLLGAQGQGQVVVNLEQAREVIDMVVVLREKTKGNLAPQEDAVLTETLAELQRLFAARMQQAQQQAMQDAGINQQDLRNEPPQ